ncbi:MAG: hypothetical protein VW547_15230 [Alphaproteobacteria bacterium]
MLYLKEPLGPGGGARPGNMFIPIDELLQIYDDMISSGRAAREPQPWVGVYVNTAEHRL